MTININEIIKDLPKEHFSEEIKIPIIFLDIVLGFENKIIEGERKWTLKSISSYEG